MDTFLAIASRREVREYDGRPLPAEVLERILDAGRLSGSARNRQPWRFVLVESAEAREQLAGLVFMPANVRGAAAIVAVVLGGGGGEGRFDTGRAAQNMMLAAWNEGVGSCPNGLADATRGAEVLGLAEDEQVPIVLTLGYPAQARDPERRSAAEWSARAARRSLDELVSRV